MCVAKCANNEIRNSSGVCVTDNSISVEPTTPDNDISTGDTSCSVNEELINGACVAKCGTNETRNSSGVCETKEVVCSDSQEKVNGVCVAKCADNEIRNNSGVCETKTVTCTDGQEKIDDQCVLKCSDSQERINGVCVAKCSDNQSRNASGVCETNEVSTASDSSSSGGNNTLGTIAGTGLLATALSNLLKGGSVSPKTDSYDIPDRQDIAETDSISFNTFVKDNNKYILQSLIAEDSSPEYYAKINLSLKNTKLTFVKGTVSVAGSGLAAQTFTALDKEFLLIKKVVKSVSLLKDTILPTSIYNTKILLTFQLL